MERPRSEVKIVIDNFKINTRYIIIYNYTDINQIIHREILTGLYTKTTVKDGYRFVHFRKVKDLFYNGPYTDHCFPLIGTLYFERIFDKTIQTRMEDNSLKLILRNLIDPTFKHYLFDDFKS